MHVSYFNCCLYALNAVISDCRAGYIYHLLHCWHQHWASCYQVCCLIIDDGSLIILLQYSLHQHSVLHVPTTVTGYALVNTELMLYSVILWSQHCAGVLPHMVVASKQLAHNPCLSPVWSTGLEAGAGTGSTRFQHLRDFPFTNRCIWKYFTCTVKYDLAVAIIFKCPC